MKKGARIRKKARSLGFDLVGIVQVRPVPDLYFFRWWLDQGFAGTMDYLRRGLEKRSDPEKILPGVRSIICCGLNYCTGNPPLPPFAKGGQGGISRYARGEDYHRSVGERLGKLEAFLRAEIDATAGTKVFVDTGPLLEKSYAARAGLGWIGKNACLVNPEIGSFFALGEVLTTTAFEEEEYDRPVADRCGGCTRCLEACPTGALVAPRVLDARRCIAYLTTAHRGELTPEQQGMIGAHTCGCDLCQEACPFNCV